jgi:hypothetical protein
MAGLIESMLAGGGQGAANASTQNTAAAQNMNLQQMQIEVKTLMDQRIAERAAQGEQAKYDRTREDTKTDMETKHGYDLELQKERNKPYTTGARGSKAGAREADFDRWKQDNPDGTWEEFQRLSVDIKSNQEKQITDAALKLKQADPYLPIDQAREQATQLVMGKTADRAAPTKPFNLKDFQK